MMTSDAAPQQEENRLLAALAAAMVERPRASLQDLARAVGVSKATLYRFCSTRDELVQRLLKHSTATLGHAIQAAQLEDAPPLEALRRLTANNLEHRELTAFLMHYWKEDATGACAEDQWERQLDSFFLRGQQSGVFRIDIAAPALTEIWVALLLGLVDAERRGRIARVGVATLLENAFLKGASAP